MNDAAVREILARALAWEEAHVPFDDAVANVPAGHRARRAAASPHTLWQLLEHIRIAQADLLDFCRNPEYRAKEWPRDYWPETPEPPDADAWDRSVAAVIADRGALADLTLDDSLDLTAPVPAGDGQTYLREILLALDHTAYHVGQMVALRKALDDWG